MTVDSVLMADASARFLQVETRDGKKVLAQLWDTGFGMACSFFACGFRRAMFWPGEPCSRK